MVSIKTSVTLVTPLVSHLSNFLIAYLNNKKKASVILIESVEQLSIAHYLHFRKIIIDSWDCVCVPECCLFFRQFGMALEKCKRCCQ